MIGEKLGFDVKIQDMDFNSLVPALQAGKIDFVISGMSPNKDREKVVDFSEPYNETQQVLVVKKDSGIKASTDLAGKTVGVQTASIRRNGKRNGENNTILKSKVVHVFLKSCKI